MAFDILARLKLIDNLSAPMKKALQSFTQMDKVANTTSKSADRMTRSAVAAGSSFSRMGAAANKALTGISAQASNTSSALTGVGLAVGAVVAGAGALKVVKDSLKGASDIEQNTTAMEHFIGLTQGAEKAKEATKSYVEYLEKNATLTPFETGDVMNAGRRLINVTSGDIDQAKQLLTVSENMAALNPGKSLMDAVEALADMKTGEMERMKEFGFKITAEDVEKAGGGAKGAMKLMLTDVAKTFEGGADKLSKTSLGMWGVVTGSFKSGIAKMGVEALNRLSPQLDKLSKAFSSGALDKYFNMGSAALVRLTEKAIAFGNWLVEIQPRVAAVFSDISKDIASLTEKFGGVGGAAKSVVDYLLNNWSTLKPIIYGVVGAISAWTVAQAALNIALVANPIGLVITAIGALAGAAYAIYKNWDYWKAKTLELWDALGPVGKAIVFLASGPFGWLVAAGIAIYKNWDAIKTKAVELWDRLGPIGPALVALTGPIGAVVMGGISLIKNWDAIRDGAIGLWNGVKSAFTSGVNHVINKINVLIEAYNKVAGKIKKIDPIKPIGDSTTANVVKATNPPMTAEASAGPSPNPLMRNGWSGAPKHAGGLERVPYDGYAATLHKDERIQTKAEADSYRSGKSNGGDTINFTLNYSGQRLGEDEVDEIMGLFARRIWDARSAVAY